MTDIMPVEYGCECADDKCFAHDAENPASEAPIAYLVSRHNGVVKICTMCLRSTDTNPTIIIDEKQTIGPWMKYDLMGCIGIGLRWAMMERNDS